MVLEPIEITGILFGAFSGGISLVILVARTFLWEKPRLKIEATRAVHYDQAWDSSRPEESKRTSFFVDFLIDNTGDRSTRITRIETTIVGKSFRHQVSNTYESPESRVGAHDSTSVRAGDNLGKKLEDEELGLLSVVHHTHGKREVSCVSRRA